MNTVEPNPTESLDFETNEIDNDSSVVNYEFIPKPDLKTILKSQLDKNIRMQSLARSLVSTIEDYGIDSESPFDSLSSVDHNRITLSAKICLENALRRARDSSLN